MIEQRNERGVVLDDAVDVLADHRGLHPVVEQLGRRAVHGGEGVDVTTQNCLQVLGRAKPTPEPAAVAQDDREQPQVRTTPGSSVNSTWNWAKSTWRLLDRQAVSKRALEGLRPAAAGRRAGNP